MSTSPSDGVSARARSALLVAAGLTFALYLVPYGRYLAWPLMLFSTFAHEMGHGIAAVLVGGQFESFRMWPDGSGVAQAVGFTGALSSAAVSAGGLFGPALVALVLFVLARRPLAARIALYAGGVVLVVTCAWVVRNLFGVFFVALCGVAALFLARKLAPSSAQIAVVFVAMQLSLSVFSRADYLFTDVARTGAGQLPSDTAQIARSLGGPYWLWGAIIGAFSVLVLVVGLWFFVRGGRRAAPALASRRAA